MGQLQNLHFYAQYEKVKIKNALTLHLHYFKLETNIHNCILIKISRKFFDQKQEKKSGPKVLTI